MVSPVVKHAFQSAKSDGPDPTNIQPSNWNANHTITVSQSALLGATAAGAVAEIPFTQFWANAFAYSDGTGIGLPAGTVALFAQSAAPTGWSKLVDINDAVLRVVTGVAGSGGSTAFSAAFNGGGATAAHALTIAEMPSHNHGINDPGHSHSYVEVTGNNSSYAAGGSNAQANAQTGVSTTGITIQANGGGNAHSHGLPALSYVDVIRCQKN